MAELKTKPNEQSVEVFLSGVADENRRQDCLALINLMKEVTGAEAKMWGDRIVGFGSYHYCYESGREGDWFLTGFSPRKNNLTLYIMSGFEQSEALLQKLGKHTTGKACLHVKRLQDIDQAVLKELVTHSVEYIRKTNT